MKNISLVLTGLYVNAGIIPSFDFDRHGRMKTFMGEIIILYNNHIIKVTTTEILYDGAKVSWTDSLPYNFDDVRVEVITVNGYRVMNVDFNTNIQLAIKRTNETRFHNSSIEYLNLYIENEAGLSPTSDGILGMFIIFTVSLD